MTDFERANKIAADEGGIYRVERCAAGVPAVKIVVAEAGPNHGATLWQGPVSASVEEVRRMSIRTRVARTAVPELPEGY
jgi:hypothetical protein